MSEGSDGGAVRNILSPESMPVVVVVFGALALLAVAMNFYNWSLVQQAATRSDVMNAAQMAQTTRTTLEKRLDAMEGQLGEMKTQLDDANAKMMAMTEAAEAQGEAAGGEMPPE